MRIVIQLVLAWALAGFTALCWAVGDVNQLDATQLQAVKGIGPKLSTRIVEARERSAFRDWNDFIDRVPGVGERTAQKFSTQGLTVNGQPYGKGKGQTAGQRGDKVIAYAPRKPAPPPPQPGETAALRR